jgi:hypothetical protein
LGGLDEGRFGCKEFARRVSLLGSPPDDSERHYLRVGEQPIGNGFDVSYDRALWQALSHRTDHVATLKGRR